MTGCVSIWGGIRPNRGDLRPTGHGSASFEWMDAANTGRRRGPLLQAASDTGMHDSQEPQNQFWGHQRNFKVLDPSGLELTIYSDIPGKETEKNHAD